MSHKISRNDLLIWVIQWKKFSFSENWAWLSPGRFTKPRQILMLKDIELKRFFQREFPRNFGRLGFFLVSTRGDGLLNSHHRTMEHFYCAVLSNSLLQNLVQQYVECVFSQFLRKVISKGPCARWRYLFLATVTFEPFHILQTSTQEVMQPCQSKFYFLEKCHWPQMSPREVEISLPEVEISTPNEAYFLNVWSQTVTHLVRTFRDARRSMEANNT